MALLKSVPEERIFLNKFFPFLAAELNEKKDGMHYFNAKTLLIFADAIGARSMSGEEAEKRCRCSCSGNECTGTGFEGYWLRPWCSC